MNYNKTKWIVGLIGSIAAILLGTLSFIGGLLFTVRMISNNAFEFMTVETIMFILLTISGVMLIIFGAITCKKPFVKDGKLSFRLGKVITILVFGFIAVLACIIPSVSDAAMFLVFIIGFGGGFVAFEIILFLAVAALEIVALCLKPLKDGQDLVIDENGKSLPKAKYVEDPNAPVYNPLRRVFEIVTGLIAFAFGTYLVFQFISVIGHTETGVGFTMTILEIIVLFVGIALMVIGLLSVKKPKFIDGEYKTLRWARITIYILVSFILFEEFVWGVMAYLVWGLAEFGFNFDYGIVALSIIVIGLEIIVGQIPALKVDSLFVKKDMAKPESAIETKAEEPEKQAPAKNEEKTAPVKKVVKPAAPKKAETNATEKNVPPRQNGRFVKRS